MAKQNRIEIRVSDEQKAEYSARAEGQGLTLSEWLLSVIELKIMRPPIAEDAAKVIKTPAQAESVAKHITKAAIANAPQQGNSEKEARKLAMQQKFLAKSVKKNGNS